jgi:hypothetical protein
MMFSKSAQVLFTENERFNRFQKIITIDGSSTEEKCTVRLVATLLSIRLSQCLLDKLHTRQNKSYERESEREMKSQVKIDEMTGVGLGPWIPWIRFPN